MGFDHYKCAQTERTDRDRPPDSHRAKTLAGGFNQSVYHAAQPDYGQYCAHPIQF
jgi:hypothetical protein